MMKKERIGIYGGTFSPPHIGHHRALSAFLQQEQLDRVYVIPTLQPPHKPLQGDATPQQRLAMCRLAFADLPVTVSDMEIKRGGKSYTVLTLEELKRADNTLVLLCGSDMFLSIDRWYQPQRIFALAEIVYVQREDGEHAEQVAQALAAQAMRLQQQYNAVTRPLACRAIEISSTMLRQELAQGNETSFLSPSVKEYIDQCQLYT